MKDNKKVYSQPQTTLLYMENQEMICSSVQPQPNNPIQIDNGYNNAVSIMVARKSGKFVFYKRNNKKWSIDI